MAVSARATGMPRPTVLNWIVLLLLGLIWGASFLGTKLALLGFGPLTIATLRISIAAAVLLAVAFASGHGLPNHRTPTGRRIWLHCFGMALFSNAIPFSLLSWGQLHVTSAFAGVTMAVVPLLILPLAHVFVSGERLSPRKGVGFLVGFAGVITLIGPGSFSLIGDDALANTARLACVVAACCYAAGAIITRLTPPGHMLSFSAAAVLIAAVLLVPLALVVEGVPQVPPPLALGGILYLGLLPTALATVMLVFIITSAGPSFLSLVNYQVPVWAVIIGLMVLGESLPPQFFAALVLILAGLGVAQAPLRRRLKTRP